MNSLAQCLFGAETHSVSSGFWQVWLSEPPHEGSLLALLEDGGWGLENKWTVMGTPHREPQEYSRNIIVIYLQGCSYSIIFLLYSWGSLFGVPIEVPLEKPPNP